MPRNTAPPAPGRARPRPGKTLTLDQVRKLPATCRVEDVAAALGVGRATASRSSPPAWSSFWKPGPGREGTCRLAAANRALAAVCVPITHQLPAPAARPPRVTASEPTMSMS
jgi:hypothetical protein